MRFDVHLRKLSSRPLPFDYQYPLACWFLRCLNVGDPELADEVHASTGFKPYCFSNLLPVEGRVTRDGLEFTHARVILSSPDPNFVRALAEGLLTQPEFELMRHRFAVDEVRLLSHVSVGSRARFRTLSPVYVKTARKVETVAVAQGSGGTANLLAERPPLRERDLYPSDGKFYENVLIGRELNRSRYPRARKDIAVGSGKYDFVRTGDILEVHDVKKSKSFDETHRLQLLYYLHTLARGGIRAVGVLDYPSTNRHERIEPTAEDFSSVEAAIAAIPKLYEMAVLKGLIT